MPRFMPRVAFATPFILHKITMDFIGFNKGGCMRQRFIIANLFLISTLVLSGCATQLGAKLACEVKAKDGGGVKHWKEKTGRLICTTNGRVAVNPSPNPNDILYGKVNSTTTCEPEYEWVHNREEYSRFMKACIASMTKNK